MVNTESFQTASEQLYITGPIGHMVTSLPATQTCGRKEKPERHIPAFSQVLPRLVRLTDCLGTTVTQAVLM